LGTVTRTVCFTDLANYTQKVSRSDREGLRRILEEHEQLVRPIVQQYSGRIVKNLGDSFLILFESATDALRAAIDVQHLVHQEGSTSIRLAMTTGDVEEIEGDAFGEAVNLAARILGKAPAEEIWFGPGTRVCMNAAEIPWEEVGLFSMKGIPDDKTVFRAVPRHKCWLPEPVKLAARNRNLVRIKRGARPPLLPPDPIVLFEGFAPGSAALEDAVNALPVLNPTSLWLVGYNIAGEDRRSWTENGRGLVIGTSEAVSAAIEEAQQVQNRASGSDTIVLDVGINADLELVMCGLALPAVPLSDVVASYFYELLSDGRWVNRSERASARVEVNQDGVAIRALQTGVTVDGRPLGSGDAVRIADGARIHTPTLDLTFVAVGAPYAGLLLADTEMRLGVMDGHTATLGREPAHPGLAYPDRRGQDNIRWCSGPRAARARAGGFTLDRALAGRHQASVALSGSSILVRQIHERCPTYVFDESTRALTKLSVKDQTHAAQVGSLVFAGTTVVGLRSPEG
jgi:class 3 adenylate cyclase